MPHVAFFKNKLDNQPQCVDVSWAKLAGRLQNHEEREEKDGPLWSPTHYVRGAPRGNDGVLAVTAAVGDFDDGSTWEDVKAQLGDCEYVAHSTHSYDPEHPKFRVVIPLIAPVSRTDWPIIKAKIDYHVFGMASDPAAKDASRIYYLPSCPPGSMKFAYHSAGHPLDARALPEVPTTAQPTNGSAVTGGSGLLYKRALDFVANGAPIGQQRARAVAAARNYLSAGYTVSETAAATWRGLQVCQQDTSKAPWTADDAYQIASNIASSPTPVMTNPPVEHESEPQPAFTHRGMGYTYEVPATGLRFNIDFLTRTADDIRATVVAERRNSVATWVRVHRAKMLMEGGRSKSDFAKQCQELYSDDADGKYWRSIVEDASIRVLDAEEEGEPVVMVGQLPDEIQYFPVVDRLLPTFKPTVIYGPGGVGKGYIATGIAVCVQSGKPFLGLEVQQCNVLYLDWEDDQSELDLRVKEVSAGLGMNKPVQIARRGCAGSSLRSQVPFLSKWIAEHNIGLVIVDSVEAATGTASEGASFHSLTAAFYEALHKLGRLTFLLIDHVTATGRTNQASGNKIFGSVFKENWARSTWEVRKDQKTGERVSHVALYHTKVNRGMLENPIGVELDFSEEGSVTLLRWDVTESKELSNRLPGTERIMAVLHDIDGPMSAAQIEEELRNDDPKVTSNKVRTWLGRLKDRNKVVKVSDGRWELLPEVPLARKEEIPW